MGVSNLRCAACGVGIGVGVRRRRAASATICGDDLRRQSAASATICGVGDNLRRQSAATIKHFKFLNSRGVFGSIDIDIDIFTLDIFTPIPESFPPMLTQNCLF